MTDTLPDLPVEMIERCWSFVEDQTTLAAICRTSILGKRFGTPRLYHTVGFSDMSIHESWRLISLATTLLENSGLRDLVKVFQYCFNEENNSELHDDFPSVNFGRLLYPIFRDGEGDLRSILLHQCPKKAVSDVCAIFVISLCPQLHTLTLSGDLDQLFDLRDARRLSLEEFPPSAALEKGPACELYPFPNGFKGLKEVHLYGSDFIHEEHFIAPCIDPVLKLPISLLHVDHLMGSEDFGIDIDLRGSKIKHLSLTHCFAQCLDLAALVKACPKLAILDVQLSSDQSAHCRGDWRVLSDVLKRRKKLEKIRIVDDVFRPYNLHGRILWKGSHEYEIERAQRSFMQEALALPLKAPNLKNVMLTENALFGSVKNYWEEDYAITDDDTGEDIVMEGALPRPLHELLPNSVQILTVVLPERRLNPTKAKRFLEDPRASELEDFIVMNSGGQHWISKKDGEGGFNLEEHLIDESVEEGEGGYNLEEDLIDDTVEEESHESDWS
jgi:hypothetical protein